MITTPKDFFEEIGRFGPISGLFLTYTLDQDVIEKLVEVCPGTVIILHDHRCGVSLEDNHRHKVVCLPVAFSNEQEANCFHPKLALLRNESEAMIMIGSANLSRGAFVREKELVASGRMKLDHPICKAAIRFLRTQADHLVHGSELLLDALSRFEVHSSNSKEEEDKKLLFNTEESIFDQLGRLLPGDLVFDAIHIISPFLPREAAWLKVFRKRFKSTGYRFHLRVSDRTTRAIKQVFPDSEIVSPKGHNSFHYKAYIFRAKKVDYIVLGSANFTTQGFFRSANERGNMECVLVLRVPSSAPLTKWLKDSWKHPVSMSDVIANDSLGQVDEGIQEASLPYAHAQREEKQTKVVLYVPESYSIQKIRCTPSLTRDWEPIIDQPGFYVGFTGICQQLTLKSNEPKWEQKICVFNEDEFVNLYTYYGDSLFSEPDKTNSIRTKELREALHRSARVIRAGASTIAQRPFLEQYHKNVQTRLKFLHSKAYFSAWHESELTALLKEEDGGAGCFLLLKLIQFFSKHHAGKNMTELCRSEFNTYLQEEHFKQVNLEKLIELMDKIEQ